VLLDAFEWERLVRSFPAAHLSATEKLVAMMLRSYADPDGTRCRPGVERLAAATSLHRVTVIRALGRLEDKGLIRHRRFGGGRGNTRGYATLYELTLPPESVLRSAGLLVAELPGAEDLDHDGGRVLEVRLA
jgi:hypothetical protein